MSETLTAVTGTPATGKTTFSQKLAPRIGAEVIDLKEVVTENKLYEFRDEEEDALVVEPSVLDSFLKKTIKVQGKSIIYDGLLSHLVEVDQIIVLRCNPKILLQRYRERGYSSTKIRENLEAEYVGVVLEQSLATGKPVLEVDNSCKLNLENIVQWLSKPETKESSVDYTSEFEEIINQGF
ncbi:adenylate kinase family protein [Candidatus Altiarchaeota archaeon]